MLDLGKLASQGVAGLEKLNELAGKVEEVVTKGGPEAIAVLEEIRTVLNEVGPVLQQIMPLITMLSNFFPHATPPKPAGQH